MVSQLEEAMLKHMRYLALTEGRPSSYLDFRSFEFNGKTYGMSHGTYRNKIWEFKKAGKVETEYNAGTAFHTLKGVHFGKRKRMVTPAMTPNHMVVSPVTGVTNTEGITKLPIYKEMQKLPPKKRALHDIHLKFQVPDIRTIISSSKKYTSNPVSKDISLPPIITNNLKVRTIVHRTDTVTVTVACSFAPVATDTDGLIRLSNALTRAEERTSRIVDECGNMLLLILRATRSWSTINTV
jgi:hypothetical protein